MYYIRTKCKGWYVHKLHGVLFVSWISVLNLKHLDIRLMELFPKENIKQWINIISTTAKVDCEAVHRDKIDD